MKIIFDTKTVGSYERGYRDYLTIAIYAQNHTWDYSIDFAASSFLSELCAITKKHCSTQECLDLRFNDASRDLSSYLRWLMNHYTVSTLASSGNFFLQNNIEKLFPNLNSLTLWQEVADAVLLTNNIEKLLPNLASLTLMNISLLEKNHHLLIENLNILCSSKLKNLSINGCKFGDDDFKKYIYPIIDKHQSLSHLNLSDNDLTNYTLFEIAELLKKNESLKTINLGENCIESKAIVFLTDVVKNHNFTVEDIQFSHYQQKFQISDRERQKLTTYLTRNALICKIQNESDTEKQLAMVGDFINKIRLYLPQKQQFLSAQSINSMLGKSYANNIFYSWIFLYPLYQLNPEKYSEIGSILSQTLFLTKDINLSVREKSQLMLILMSENQNPDNFFNKVAISGLINDSFNLENFSGADLIINKLISLNDINRLLDSNILSSNQINGKIILEELLINPTQELSTNKELDTVEKIEKFIIKLNQRYVQLKKDVFKKLYLEITSKLLESLSEEDKDDYTLVLWREHLQSSGSYFKIYDELNRNGLSKEKLNILGDENFENPISHNRISSLVKQNPFTAQKLPFFTKDAPLMLRENTEEKQENSCFIIIPSSEDNDDAEHYQMNSSWV